MHLTIKEYVQSCEVCQKNKTDNLSLERLLQPLLIPCQVWDDITMDFIEGLPSSHGRNTILVIIDCLSKYAHFLLLSHPQSIINDRDPIFISKFQQEFFKMSGTQLKMSFAYHSQTDGQSKVVNHCVEQYLCCFVYQQPCQWSTFLHWAELWQNTAYHSSTSMTPFQALYRRPSLVIPLYSMRFSPVDEVDHSLATRYALLKHVKENLATTRNRMKQIADHGRRDVTFQEGDLVFLKLQPYC